MSVLSDDFPAMLERESSHTLPNGHPVNVPESTPEVAVAFGMHYLLDPKKTAEAGHEVFRDVTFIKIAVPGDKNSLYFQPATDLHKVRFPKAWAAFQQRTAGGQGRTGLPIEEWAPISRGMALTLKACHIHTVEDLAVVHDGHIDKIGGDARSLRAKAQAFLAQAKDSAATLRLAQEKEELQGQLKAMQEMILGLQAAQVAQQSAAPAEGAPAPTPAAPADDPEKAEMRETMATLQRQMAQLLAAQNQPAAPAAPPSATNPEAARKPRGFQKKTEATA